jgi:hypothetical protein
MGPLPKTKRGNEYVLMMVDKFTKWTECIPLPSQTAEITAQAAIHPNFPGSYPQNILLHPSSFYSAFPPDHWRMVYKALYELYVFAANHTQL